MPEIKIPALRAAAVLTAAILMAACTTRGTPPSRMSGMHSMQDVSSEYEFLAGMIPHHQEAVDTSRTIAARTVRPELRAFTEGIARDQEREIGMMREWLTRWYPGRSGKAEYRPMMRPTAGLSPDRADRAWLEDMIMHHRMAILMADSVLRGGFRIRPEVSDLARAIIEAQNEEIEIMENWLSEWYGASAGGMHGMH